MHLKDYSNNQIKLIIKYNITVNTFNHHQPIKNQEDLKVQILQAIDTPSVLEKLYRTNKKSFHEVFNEVYEEIKNTTVAQIWNERLNYQEDEINWGNKNDFLFVFIATLITGFIAKLPFFTGINEESFYTKNLSFLVFPALILYFSWKQNLEVKKILFPLISTFLAILYINFLPNIHTHKSDAVLLACIHLPIVLWSLLGYTFVGGQWKNTSKKIEFLQYNGDFVVMTALILLSGGIFTGITIGLFEIININIETIYFEYVVVWGLSAVPMISTYLIRNNPQLVGRISPVIARIFTPVVFSTLLIFLLVLIYTGKGLYTDRNFLLVFNNVLIGVMAIILFSATEATKSNKNKFNLLFLLGLSVLAIILNGLALSAISFRLIEFGITQNRIAVLGSNLLIFSNLIVVAFQLFNVLRKGNDIQKVEHVIALFIPVYGIWAALVTFVLPFVFHLK